jgi:hypothetical protein
MTTLLHGVQNTPRSRAETNSSQATSGTNLRDGTVPKADCRSLQRVISQLVTTALSPFSSPPPHTQEESTAPHMKNPSPQQTEQLGFFNRLLARLRVGFTATVAHAAEFVRSLATTMLRALGKDTQNTVPLSVIDPTMPRAHGTISGSSAITGDERTSGVQDPQRTRVDDPCSSVAEACQKSARKKKAQEDRSKLERARHNKDATAERIKGIDAENGITNPDLPIIIANMMSSFGAESTAIRATIEAQAREVDPRKKKT